VLHEAGPFKIIVRLRSASRLPGGSSRSGRRKGSPVRKRENIPFQYQAAGSWEQVELATAESGTLFSLWINADANHPVEIAGITDRS